MIQLLPFLSLVSVAGFLYFKWRNHQIIRQRLGAPVRKNIDINWIEHITGSIKQEIEYATPEINHVYPITITAMLFLALVGVLIGQMLNSYLLSILLIFILGIIPWIVLRVLSNRKLRKLEMELPTFVTDLVHHLREKKDIKSALMSVDNISIIYKDQQRMKEDLANNVPPDDALRRLYLKTRSRWFLLIGQLASVMETRANLAAIVQQFMKMQIEIQQANLRIQKAHQRTQKKARTLLIIEVVFIFGIYYTIKIIQDPLYYFTQTEKGQTQLFIGILFALIPVIYLLYLSLRRR